MCLQLQNTARAILQPSPQNWTCPLDMAKEKKTNHTYASAKLNQTQFQKRKENKLREPLNGALQ